MTSHESQCQSWKEAPVPRWARGPEGSYTAAAALTHARVLKAPQGLRSGRTPAMGGHGSCQGLVVAGRIAWSGAWLLGTGPGGMQGAELGSLEPHTARRRRGNASRAGHRGTRRPASGQDCNSQACTAARGGVHSALSLCTRARHARKSGPVCERIGGGAGSTALVVGTEATGGKGRVQGGRRKGAHKDAAAAHGVQEWGWAQRRCHMRRGPWHWGGQGPVMDACG